MALVSLFTVVAFSSCSNDRDNETDGGSSGRIEGNKLPASVENGASYDSQIDLVKAEIWHEGNPGDSVLIPHTVATVPYSNGVFTLNLPESVDARYLEAMFYDDLPPSGVTVSNRNAKGASVDLEAYKSDNNAGYIYCATGADWVGRLVYMDADVSITGSYSETAYGIEYTYTSKYNIRFERGWNMVYEKKTEKGTVTEYEITTTAPAGLKWYVGYLADYHAFYYAYCYTHVRPASANQGIRFIK
ncbi:MAG: hypothetical protein LBH60_07915 [Prevotellaceae bacterium]|nr:hypothetical protein [Prevotellaceae bacterium]